MYPALAVPVLLALGFGLVPHEAFLAAAILSTVLISGEHFGVLSIAGIFYPSAIRASGAGWATSVAKLGAIVGPIIGAVVLSSGMPIVRSYALLAVCPTILCVCALGIAAVGAVAGRRPPVMRLPSLRSDPEMHHDDFTQPRSQFLHPALALARAWAVGSRHDQAENRGGEFLL